MKQQLAFSDEGLRKATRAELNETLEKARAMARGLYQMAATIHGTESQLTHLRELGLTIDQEADRIEREIFRRENLPLRRLYSGITTFFARLVSPHRHAVAVAIAALKQIEQQNSVPGLYLVKSEVIQTLKSQQTKTHASIVEDRMPAVGLAYLLIMNVALRQLVSGHHHIYRGVLSGTGHELMATYEIASSKLVKLSVQTEVDHDNGLFELRKEVRSVG